MGLGEYVLLSMRYRIEKLEAGTYAISSRLQLDVDGSDIVYDPIGYYDGTLEAPITELSNAKLITVGTGTVSGIDFALAKVPPQ